MKKEFYIKNMVCRSCIKIIRDALQQKNFNITEVELGKVVIETDDVTETKRQLTEILKINDFDLIGTPEEKQVEQVKLALIELVKNLECLDIKLSGYLKDRLHQDYFTLSKVFSFNQQITIEKYFIKLKIEKVKELIHSQEYNFTEISQMLGYSNLGHLSGQFKTETGMSLTEYKGMGANLRNSLNRIL
ncbi:Helix-turn-helix domain-containing protein [Flagellimonas taeanensis]|uniref:Helix-turn-helix domain-containing protein n=1 Tax=Flagellimonas taeanensis TaxID=1005926 RepID=A0A1M7B7I5_9FLAO|nr:helix-turn-helix domain-containing protein [Allomuricauda taeanensis]SFC38344.1 Helix-turn-helix domain-containing protein [Allomuricauda taeanensis]SHL50952.1 Helix-turn-helix domain-containing protein [Allomuricauda taeanensis]